MLTKLEKELESLKELSASDELQDLLSQVKRSKKLAVSGKYQ
jgi:hypothetical protein